MNLIGAGAVVSAILAHFVRQRDRYQRESDELLLNMLPAPIATRLKSSHEMIAEEFDGVSVLSADIVDFTQMSSRMTPEALVGLLNDVFSRFDAFVDDLGLEKIKTVGDAYMAAAGVPMRRADHAIAIAELALRIQETLAREQFHGHRLAMRIGINSGPVVAEIIGRHKFAYDLWGDAVNTASRMESVGIGGAIQITQATHDLIRDAYRCEPRGEVGVKGKGSMPAYLLIGRLRSTTPSASPNASLSGPAPG
ncbi:MAG: adenylate/guanylate cyclase domain-containing protein [Chloroflexi bacterium]|nr:adenylate/guanylate cyclase domain-containing protein [Chloroflexota bacterium]